MSATAGTPIRFDRAQALELGVWLVTERERWRREQALGGLLLFVDQAVATDRGYADVLDRFLEAFPAEPSDPPFHRLHARLTRPADPAKAAAFVEWLRERVARGPGLKEHPQGEEWAAGRAWKELARVLGLPEDPAAASPAI